jgi:hypothetical protein
MTLRSGSALGLAVAAASLAACKSSDGPWTYSLTRSLWGSLGEASATYSEDHIPWAREEQESPRLDYHSGTPLEARNDAEGLAGLLAALVVLMIVAPIAIDTVLLPVTVTHDLVVAE